MAFEHDITLAFKWFRRKIFCFAPFFFFSSDIMVNDLVFIRRHSSELKDVWSETNRTKRTYIESSKPSMHCCCVNMCDLATNFGETTCYTNIHGFWPERMRIHGVRKTAAPLNIKPAHNLHNISVLWTITYVCVCCEFLWKSSDNPNKFQLVRTTTSALRACEYERDRRQDCKRTVWLMSLRSVCIALCVRVLCLLEISFKLDKP